MMFGLKEHDYQIFDAVIVQPLKALGAGIYVFGSRASGRNHPFSDIDLLIEPAGDVQELRIKLPAIKEAIEESRFPIKVDFVIAQDLAQSYRETVLKERVKIL